MSRQAASNQPAEGATVEVVVRGVVHYGESSGFYVRPAACASSNTAWVCSPIAGYDDVTVRPLALQVADVEVVDVAPVPTVEQIQTALARLPFSEQRDPAALRLALYGRPRTPRSGTDPR